MKAITWHQVFSDYGNLKFQPNGNVEKIRIKQNLAADGVCIELSNRFDEAPLMIKRLVIATNSAMENSQAVTLNANKAFVVPGKQALWTDFIVMEIPENSHLYLEFEAENKPNQLASSAHNFSETLFQTTAEFGLNYLYGITSIALHVNQPVITIGFFGDSLTNQGFYTDAATDWLYQRFRHLSTINEGISGNRLLLKGTSDSEWNASFGQPAVTRFREFVTYQPTVIVILVGLNDLYQADQEENPAEMPTFQKLIEAFVRMKNEASVANILPILVTWTPFKGAMSGEKPAWTKEKEQIRCQVNQWIRAQAPMIDLATFVQDQLESEKLAEAFDSGDHLHFSKEGGSIIGAFMAEEITKLLKETGYQLNERF